MTAASRYAAMKTAPKSVTTKLTVLVMTPNAPPSTLPAADLTAPTRSSLTLEMSCCGSLGKSPLACKESSASLRYRSTVLAIPGMALTRAANCSTKSGTRKSAASTKMPTTSRNETRIASPRGMSSESQRTGKESARASTKPPTTVVSTVGTCQITSPSKASTARIRAVRVRLEIRIGVGWAVTSGSAVASRSDPGRPRPRSRPTSRFTNHSPCPGPRPLGRLSVLLDPGADAGGQPDLSLPASPVEQGIGHPGSSCVHQVVQRIYGYLLRSPLGEWRCDSPGRQHYPLAAPDPPAVC